MSEIMRHESPPDAPLAPVIPFPREAEAIEQDETLDFSTLSRHETTEFLIRVFNHPSHRSQINMTLAESIDREFAGNSGNPTSFQERLTEVLDEAESTYFDDSIYNYKLEHDQVFQGYVQAIKNSGGARGVELPRKVALKLLTLRSAEADTSDDDELWINVLERLFINRPQ